GQWSEGNEREADLQLFARQGGPGAGHAAIRGRERGRHSGAGGGRALHDRGGLVGDRGRCQGNRVRGAAGLGGPVLGVHRQRRAGLAVRGLHQATGDHGGPCGQGSHDRGSRKGRRGGRGRREGGGVRLI